MTNKNKNEDFQQKCKNCGHDKFEHVNHVVFDEEIESSIKPRTTRWGRCDVKGCDCEEFDIVELKK